MKNALRNLIYCALSFITTSAVAQNLDETFRFGKEQFALGNYKAASLAFERVRYFGRGLYLTSTLDHLARIEAKYGRLEHAISLYGQASLSAETVNEQAWFTLRKCALLIQSGNPQFAKIELLGIPDGVEDSLFRYQNFLLGVEAFSVYEFEQSRTSFKAAVSHDTIKARLKIDSLFDALAGIRHPNPRTARLLSMIIPGAGQFYAGDIKNGINSFLLTGAFIALGITVALNYSILDGIASAVPWFQRYYMGGYQRAENIARNRLRQKQDAVYQQVLKLF